MSEWQPIDTAPRDGSAILATNAGYAYELGRCVVVFWETDPVDNGEHGWMQPDDGDEVRHTWLTHWMPLPASPSQSPP